MKCTQCNSTNLVKTRLGELFYVWGDAQMLVSETLEIYVCEECGHIEFFDSSFLSKKNEEETINESYNKLISELTNKKELIDGKTKELEIELGKVMIQLSDLDITVRQQTQLKSRADEINRELKEIDKSIEKINTQISKYQSEKQQKILKIKTVTRKFK